MEINKKSGFVTIVGKPNAGKSTLINQIAKNKISIATPKRNTTRNQINFIYNDNDSQIIFIDTPGFLEITNNLDERMVEIIRRNMKEVDLVLFIIKAGEKLDQDYLKKIELIDNKTKKFLLVNKVDLVKSKAELIQDFEEYQSVNIFDEIIPISALKNTNIDVLMKEIKKYLPLDVQYYPEDQMVDYSNEFYTAEIIREKILFKFHDEIPHEVFVKVTNFDKEGGIIKIRAEIIISRESLKKIIIGKDGETIKDIGMKSRKELERYFNSKIFLETFVKIRKNWKNKESIIKEI